MSVRIAAFAVAASIAALASSSPGRAAEAAATQSGYSQPGYNYDAEHVHGGVRWGYAGLYRSPIEGGSFSGCAWMSVATAYGIRHRPTCAAQAM